MYLADESVIKELRKEITALWPTSDLEWVGPDKTARYLGVEIRYQSSSQAYSISQQAYIVAELLRTHNTQDAPHTHTHTTADPTRVAGTDAELRILRPLVERAARSGFDFGPSQSRRGGVRPVPVEREPLLRRSGLEEAGLAPPADLDEDGGATFGWWVLVALVVLVSTFGRGKKAPQP